jgi:hypothetical protein
VIIIYLYVTTITMHTPKLNEIHIKDLMSFQDSVMLQMAAKQDEFYKEVLRQIIKREPTIEDAKDITLATHPDYPNQELIAYKDQPIGRIIKGWDVGNYTTSFKWTFEPNPTFKQNGTI